MNIFALDDDPERAARAHCDRHTYSMFKEACQLLATAHAVLDGAQPPIKPTHPNHPVARWVRATSRNFIWTATLAFYLSDEYTRRYGRAHEYEGTSGEGSVRYEVSALPTRILQGPRTPFARAMPADVVRPDPVESYRNFYVVSKARFARWERGTPPPDWWPGGLS